MAAARNRFFSSLPADELTPVEHALRKALIKALSSSNGRFPLIEWIDRRIGGEVETKRDENGMYEIFERNGSGGGNQPESGRGRGGGGGGNEVSKEAFFGSLSPEAFAAPEEALRDAVFEFLATWRSPELATLMQLTNYPAVQRARSAFLPRNVSLRDWIEHRIGGEIEFRRGSRPGDDVVHLTDAARSTVMAKFQQMQMAPPMGGGCMGGPPPHHMNGPAPMENYGAPRVPEPVSKDAFFAGLPADELLQGELDLREAILNWMNRWPSLRPANRPPGSPPHLADTGGDNEIKRCKSAFLPSKIKLVEWIEQRIGGEIELRPINNGQHEVYLRGQAPPEGKSNRDRGGRDGLREAAPARDGGGTQEEKDRFFASLPGDEFSPAEESLRTALLDFIDRWQGGAPPTLSEASTEDEISRARRQVLPRGCPVSLKEWIDMRIGGEIETKAAAGGQNIFGLRGTLGGSNNNGSGAKRRRT